MNSTGWKIVQLDSRVYYTRIDGMSPLEILTEQVIISRPAQEKEGKDLKRVQIAQKIILLGKSQLVSLIGIIVTRDCTIQIGENIMEIVNIYVGNKEYDKEVLITQSTILEILDCKRMERMENELQKLEIIDQDEHLIVNQIKELIMYPILYPRLIEKLGMDLSKGILIHGPPGVGKTRTVLELVRITRAELVSINGPEIFSPILGESEKALINAFQSASDSSKYGPCILLIDEIDALAPHRNDNYGQESRYGIWSLYDRVVAQLLTLMDGMEHRAQFVVIATTNRPNAIDPALRRPGRFDREIFIDVPQEAERLDLLKSITKKMQMSDNVDLEHVASITNGYVAADLSDLCREAFLNALSNKRTQVCRQDFDHALCNSKGPSIKRGFQLSIEKLGWSDIAGLDDIRDLLIRNIEWPLKYPEAYKRLGLRPPRGILLYGPPGCSKTTIAKILASTTKSSFYSLICAQIFSAFVGESEKILRDLFLRARMSAPSIIFLDELEAIVGSRNLEGGGGSSQDTSRDRVLSTLLNEMDGIESASGILVIGATNRPDRIDAALKRPGRLDKSIFIGPPSESGRLAILSLFTQKMPLSENVNLEDIAHRTQSFSGADLKSLCREAAFLASKKSQNSKEIVMKDFEAALDLVSPTLTEEMNRFFSNKW